MLSKESAETHGFPPSLHTMRWWSKDTVAVVTGANKGIGFAIVKRLAELGLTVILTARDYAKGQEAVEALKTLGLHVHFFCLDVSNPQSIHRFASWFQDNFSALDILINNAAVSFNDIHGNSVAHAETVMRTNYYGTKLVTEAFLPILCRSSSRSVGRILNISSRLGLLHKLKNPRLRKILMDEQSLSENEIEKMAALFLDDVKNGKWENQGWPEVWTDYAVSKLALNVYSVLLAKRYWNHGLSVNSYCPGFTQTSMTRGRGKHTADDAAQIAATIALLPPTTLPTGKFFAGNNPGGTFSKL